MIDRRIRIHIHAFTVAIIVVGVEDDPGFEKLAFARPKVLGDGIWKKKFNIMHTSMSLNSIFTFYCKL